MYSWLLSPLDGAQCSLSGEVGHNGKGVALTFRFGKDKVGKIWHTVHYDTKHIITLTHHNLLCWCSNTVYLSKNSQSRTDKRWCFKPKSQFWNKRWKNKHWGLSLLCWEEANKGKLLSRSLVLRTVWCRVSPPAAIRCLVFPYWLDGHWRNLIGPRWMWWKIGSFDFQMFSIGSFQDGHVNRVGKHFIWSVRLTLMSMTCLFEMKWWLVVLFFLERIMFHTRTWNVYLQY